VRLTNLKSIIKVLIFLLIVLAIYLLVMDKWLFNFADLDLIANKIRSFGILSPFIFIAIMATAIVISPIPSLPLAAASGIIWGPILGAFYSVVGAEIGALVSFFIARKLGREAIIKLFKKDIKISDKLTEKYGAYIIFIARLFPVFQFDIISYGAGLTNINWKKFAIATFLGMIPATLLFTSIGKSLIINHILGIVLGIILILLMFVAPLILKKYKIFEIN